MPAEYSERGFAQYIGKEGVKTGYGDVVRVYESSSAEGAFVWLSVAGSAHVDEDATIEEYSRGTMFQGKWIPPTRLIPGSVSAHLTIEQATIVRDALDEFIKENQMPEKTYKIVRFVQEEGHPDHLKVIKTGLTLEEAQAHCKDEVTHGDGWFDGYDEES